MKPINQFLTIFAGAVTAIILLSFISPQQISVRAMATPAAGASDDLAAGDPACTNTRTIQVSGSAAINVRPDRALIQLGVESTAASPEQVQADNGRAIQRITGSIRSLGIADKDIATDYYIIQPVYDDYKSFLISRYRIDNVIAVTLRDISQTSDVLLAALNAGANQVQNVQFYTSSLRQYRDEARTLAMTAAAEKAQALAEAGEAQAGCLLQIHENSWSYYNGSWWGGRERAMWSQNVVQNAAPGEQMGLTDETPISVGQVVVKAEVNATFSLK